MICALLDGVHRSEPEVCHAFPKALDFVRRLSTWADRMTDVNTDSPPSFRQFQHGLDIASELEDSGLISNGRATWFSALSATVAGFYTWCDPKDVDTAVAWVAENLPRIYAVAPLSQPS